MQQWLNVKQNKKAMKVTVTSATSWLTSVNVKELHRQHKAVWEEKKQMKGETAVCKAQEESDKQKCRQDIPTDDTVAFSGNLSSKKVAKLQDIAYLLGLKEDSMNKAALALLIKAHLNARPDLKDKP
jgi:hypothetical protein